MQQLVNQDILIGIRSPHATGQVGVVLNGVEYLLGKLRAFWNDFFVQIVGYALAGFAGHQLPQLVQEIHAQHLQLSCEFQFECFQLFLVLLALVLVL